MAYAAVVSLEQLLQSDQLPLHDPKTQLQSLLANVSTLQFSLEKFILVPEDRRETVKKLESQIRDAIYEAQDTIETFISKHSESEEIQSTSTSTFSQQLQDITKKIGPITEETKQISDSIQKQTGDPLSEDTGSAKSSFSTKIKIVGQDADQKLIMKQVQSNTSDRQIIPIIGMPGIGKTTLARSIYEHQDMVDCFNIRAWVTVSVNYNVRDIFLKLHDSLESKGQKSNKGNRESDSQLALNLSQKLHLNYLIVIDDMWDESVWDELNHYFPDNKNGSRIILTTRNREIANYIVKPPMFRHEMSLLDLENSWQLLCEKVFGGPHYLPHLYEIGRTIAENCQGLPLSLTVVGGLLTQRKTKEYWGIVAEDTKAAAAKSDAAYKQILSLSYKHLPGKLKGCFLYMAAFPEDSEILASRLIKLWLSEGLLTPPPTPPTPPAPSPPSQPKSLEEVAEQYLKDLVARNLIFVRRNSSDGQIKTCGIHDILWDIAVEESEKEKFCHSIKGYAPKLQQDKNSQRRLSVHKNVFLCVEEVYNSTKELKRARTLIFAGPHHHHPLPFSLTFELLRVLDALTVFFIRFPAEIVKLIHLRYLSFTYNRKLPSSISKLRNLQILIVRRHPKIIFMGTSMLPVEIWNMPQLRHVLFTESELPPIPFGAEKSVLLENLQSLSNVQAYCCTEEVLKKIPNLKKLGIWIEAPASVNINLDILEKLEALAFTVLNPDPDTKIALAFPVPNPDPDTKIKFLLQLPFPKTLKKLSLSGCGIPWEDITVIADLKNLEVLKLGEMAFNGETWHLDEKVLFRELKFLLLEYMHNLKVWVADDSHFPSLKCLIIRHCYELEGIPLEIGNIGGLELIELVDCSPSAVESANAIRDEQKEFDKKNFQVRIYSSWE